jgi:hypothetical protein
LLLPRFVLLRFARRAGLITVIQWLDQGDGVSEAHEQMLM